MLGAFKFSLFGEVLACSLNYLGIALEGCKF